MYYIDIFVEGYKTDRTCAGTSSDLEFILKSIEKDCRFDNSCIFKL